MAQLVVLGLTRLQLSEPLQLQLAHPALSPVRALWHRAARAGVGGRAERLHRRPAHALARPERARAHRDRPHDVPGAGAAGVLLIFVKTLTRDCFFLGLSPPFPIGRVASKRHAARDHYAASRPVRQPECVPAPSCHVRGEQRAPLRCMTWRCSAGCLSRRAPRSRWRRLTALRACAVGYEFWKQLCLEHGITQDGLIRDDIEVDSTGVAGDRKDVFVSRVVSLR